MLMVDRFVFRRRKLIILSWILLSVVICSPAFAENLFLPVDELWNCRLHTCEVHFCRWRRRQNKGKMRWVVVESKHLPTLHHHVHERSVCGVAQETETNFSAKSKVFRLLHVFAICDVQWHCFVFSNSLVGILLFSCSLDIFRCRFLSAFSHRNTVQYNVDHNSCQMNKS